MTSTLRFNLAMFAYALRSGSILKKLSRKLIELKIPSDREPSDPRAFS